MKFICDKCRTKYTIADEKVRGKVLKIRCKNCGNIIEVREPSSRPAVSSSPLKKPPTQGALKAATRHGGARRRPASSRKGPQKPGLRPSSEAASGPGAQASRPRPGSSGVSPRQASGRSGSRSSLPRPSQGSGAATSKKGPAPPGGKPVSTSLRGARGLGGRSPLPASRPAPPVEDDEPKTVVSALPQELLRELQGGGKPAPASGDEDGWFLGDDRGEYGPMTFAELAARCQRGEPGPNAEAWREGFADWRPLEEIPELKPYVKVAPPPRPMTGAHPAPASPYTKTPSKDVAGQTPAPATKAPLPAKVTSAPQPEDSLVKIPRATPDATPPPAERQWPELAPIEPSDATPPPMTAAAALTPEPFLPANAGAGATAASSTGAHVSPGVGQPPPNPSLVEIKSDRRPTLLIGAAVLLLSVGVIVLVVFLITSKKKPSSPSSTTTAEVSMAPVPPMRRVALVEPMRPAAPMKVPPEDDSTELDLDIDVSTGMVTRSMRRRAVRTAMRPKPVMVAMQMSSGGSLYGLPSMRPGFVGLMGFGSPSMTSVTGGGGGGRPGDLRSVIKRNYNRLRRCYEKAARLNSRIKNPRLRITVKVSAAGRCKSVYVSPARYQSNTLGICVRRTIMSWRWPPYSTSYRWTFSARFSAG